MVFGVKGLDEQVNAARGAAGVASNMEIPPELLGGGTGELPPLLGGIPEGYEVRKPAKKYAPGTKFYRRKKVKGKWVFEEVTNGSYSGTVYVANPRKRVAAEVARRDPRLADTAATTAQEKAAIQKRRANEQAGYLPAETTTGPKQYREGRQFVPGQWSDSARADLQRRMIKAGLLKKNFTKFGLWEQESIEAYTSLLSLANIQGRVADELLEEMMANPELSKDPDREPLTVELSSPEDLAEAVDAAAIARLGKKLDPAQKQRMIAAYHQLEREEQQQIYNAGAPGAGGGTLTAKPSTEVFFENQVRAADPVGAGAHDVAEIGNEFFSLLGGLT